MATISSGRAVVRLQPSLGDIAAAKQRGAVNGPKSYADNEKP